MLPTGTLARARMRAAVTFMVVSVLTLAAQPSLAADKPDQAEAFFDGLAIDRQLSEQYAVPAPATNAPVAPAPDPAAMLQLEQEIDAALAEADAAQARTRSTEAPPAPWHPAWILLAGIVVFASIVFALTLALRELRKEAKQRRKTYRRRVRRRGPVAEPVSVN